MLERVNLSLSDIRGQCYDGASNMSGARSGCSSLVQEQAPMAVYLHCASHRLNLAVVSACRIQAFKNTEAYIGERARFFSYSAKRQRLFDKAIELVHTPTKSRKLKDACRTRWVQRIDSYTVFLELIEPLYHTLQAMVNPTDWDSFGEKWGWDGKTVTKANGYLYQLESSSFLICFKILLEVFNQTSNAGNRHYSNAYKQVETVTAQLECMRRNEFRSIFSEAQKLGQKLHGQHFQLTRPRITHHQSHRSNPVQKSIIGSHCTTNFSLKSLRSFEKDLQKGHHMEVA